MVRLVCESCLEAADEEVSPDISSVREMSSFMVDMGADIADHLCDQIESNGEIRCACACHPRHQGSASWRGKNEHFTPAVVERVYHYSKDGFPEAKLGRDGKPLVG